MLNVGGSYDKATSVQQSESVKSFTLKKQSLAAHCPKYIVILVAFFTLTAVGFMIQECFYQQATTTYYSIEISSLPNDPNFSYSTTGEIYGYSLPDSIKYFWNSGAYCNAIVTGLCSIAWPFVYITVVLHIWLVPIKHKNRKYRTICLFILTQIGKYQFIATYGAAFLGIITAVLSDSPIIDFWVKSAASNSACLFALWSTAFIEFAFILLWIDQFYSYKKHEFPVAVYDDSKWYCLAFEESKRKRSIFGTVMYSIYLTVVIGSIYLLLESLNVAQVGFKFGGLLNVGKNPVIYNAYYIGQNLQTYLDLSGVLAENITADFKIYTIIIPLLEQSLIVLVWFVPMKNKMFRYILRFVIWLQTANCVGVYYLSAWLTGVGNEMKLYSAYLINEEELPELCGDKSFINNAFENGCYYSEAFYIWKGMVLMLCGFIVVWVSFIHTLRVANKYGVNVVKFG
eukprot:76898_1